MGANEGNNIRFLLGIFAAVTGNINGVYHKVEAQETEVDIAVHKVYHQTHRLFKRSVSSSSPRSKDILPSWQHHSTQTLGSRRQHSREYQIEADLLALVSPAHSMTTDSGTVTQSGGVVIAPHKCGIRASRDRDDMFLFVGKIRLQRARLQCAPRVEDFEKIWQRAVSDGSNPCVLEWGHYTIPTPWNEVISHNPCVLEWPHCTQSQCPGIRSLLTIPMSWNKVITQTEKRSYPVHILSGYRTLQV